MPWERLGLIYQPEPTYSWLNSHAAIPVTEHLRADVFRVYFSARDVKGRAQIGFLELEMASPWRVLSLSAEPTIGLGPLGAFDDNGVTAACLVAHEGRLYQYYTGWTLGVTVPFYFYVGLAISDDGGNSYQKVSAAPILERNAVDPYLTASPAVMVEDGRWRMWYISCTGWAVTENTPRHYYLVKYAESTDGIRWERSGHICIDFASPDEYALARPVVIKENNLYKMWFSYRGDAYHIGYAESLNGITWERKDEVGGLKPAPTGWDSEMVEYGAVFDHKGNRYMLYNGNGYGKTGIGLAAWR